MLQSLLKAINMAIAQIDIDGTIFQEKGGTSHAKEIITIAVIYVGSAVLYSCITCSKNHYMIV